MKVGRLGVDPAMLGARFAAGCNTGLCRGACCRSGVWLDVEERERVLAHAGLVRDAMDPGQPRDTRRWFSRRSVADADFPSGRAVHTRVKDGRCVFLNGEGRCVLQKAARPGLTLKPFFCTAFPVTIARGVLMLDDEDYRAGQPCCAATKGGPLTVFDTCGTELRHVLGAAGVSRLRALAIEQGGAAARPLADRASARSRWRGSTSGVAQQPPLASSATAKSIRRRSSVGTASRSRGE